MKARLFFALFLLASLPKMGWSQSTLNFPKFFSASELPVSGFAIVNPGPATASVNFTLRTKTGDIVSTSTQSYGPGTQSAQSGDQIFSNLGAGGWVQASSSATGLQGFWMNYDSALALYLDGAESATAFAEQVIPLVAGQTEIDVANPNPASGTVTIRIFGEAGIELAAAATRSIAANGVLQEQAAAIFPSVVIPDARYIKITSSGTTPMAATALIRGYLAATESAVINGVSTSSTTIELNFPHVINGNAGVTYTTEVGVTNLSGTSQNVTFTFIPVVLNGVSREVPGTPISVQKTIAANGALRSTASELFSLGPGFVNGWVKVTGTLPVTGFSDYAGGGAFAVVPVQATPRTNLIFAHIANRPPTWQTGIALLNATSTAANVELFAMTPKGVLIGGADSVVTAKFTLAPGMKVSKTLSELVPASETRTAPDLDGGFVFVRTSNSVPLYGIELFYTRDFRLLSNVASGGLAPGIAYAPPAAAQPLTISSVSPASVARGGSLTITGSGFNATPANDLVIFTSINGTVAVPATTATATLLTVTVPATAISGPLQVQTGGQTTGTNAALDVLASSTSLVQSSIVVAAGQAVSNADIYVPSVGVGALNATLVGVADLGASQVLFGSSSVEVVHGTTKMMVVAGTGIKAANGSVVSISGPGVTITGVPAFSILGDGTPYLLVTINVAADATPGPRNVVVTNSNFETSMVTGGIFIR